MERHTPLSKYNITPKEKVMEQLNKLKELVDKRETLTTIEVFNNVKCRSALYSFYIPVLYLFISSFKDNLLEGFVFSIKLFLVCFLLISFLLMAFAGYKKDTLNKASLMSHFNQKEELIINIIERNSIKNEFQIKWFRKDYSRLHQNYVYWKEKQ